MARRRKKKRGKRKFTIPVAPVAGLAVGMLKPAEEALKGNLNGVIAHLSMNYTGYDPNAKNFDVMRLKNGLVPLVMGLLVHKFIGGTLGLNRMLGQANVPVIRI